MGFYLLSQLLALMALASGGYRSFKLLKQSPPGMRVSGDAARELLMYWTVLGFVCCYEAHLELLFKWFPFYYEAKALIMFWIVLPQLQGARTLFDVAVQPLMASFRARAAPRLKQALTSTAMSVHEVVSSRTVGFVSRSELSKMENQLSRMLRVLGEGGEVVRPSE